MKLLTIFSDIDKSEYTGQPGIALRFTCGLGKYFDHISCISNSFDKSNNISDSVKLFDDNLILRGQGSLKTYISNIHKIFYFLKKGSFDYIIVNGAMLFLFFYPMLKLTNSKVIFISSEVIEHHNRIVRIIIRTLVKSIPIKIYTSHEIATQFRSSHEIGTYVLNLGVRSKFASTSVYEDKFQDIDILFWGDCNTDRGIDKVVDIANILSSAQIFVLLRWVSADSRKYYNELVKMSNVKILHYPYSEDLAMYVKRAKVVLLPFKFMGVRPPLSILEAMTMGACVYTSKMPGNSDVIENKKNGFLSDFIDSTTDADIISKLIINNNQRNKIGEAARKSMLMSLADTDIQLESIYNIALTDFNLN